MDKFIQQLGLPKCELRICNNWRMYFQVLTLADIVKPDGKYVQDRYWKASSATIMNNVEDLRRSKLRWPI